MVKIAVIGPESSGKTELCKALSLAYAAPWVEEYSREYLSKTGGQYEENDLLKIAQGQIEKEKEQSELNSSLFICDTDMHVMKVWSDYKYNRTHSWILRALDQQNHDLYLLTDYHIPYEYDPLRENPEDRAYFFDIYLKLLQESKRNFIVVKGSRAERLASARAAIDVLL